MDNLPSPQTPPANSSFYEFWRRKPLLSVLGLILLVGAMLYWFMYRTPRTVSVVGEARETVIPDKAMVSFSLSHEDADRTQAINEGERQYNQLISKVKEYSVDKIDLTPFQVTVTGTGQSRRFQYANAARVTLSDPTQMNQLIADLYFLGATRVGQPRYTTSDELVEADLRAMALQDARSRVRQIARNTGVRVGRIVSIQETNSNALSGSSINTTGGQADSEPANPDEDSAGDNLGSSTGIELSTTVVVTYELW